jgi:integrase
VDTVKSKRSERKLPIDPILMARMEKLGQGEWVFRSRTGTPVNPSKALKRRVGPAARDLSISLGGWHNFRHTTKLQRPGVHPKVASDIFDHKKVNLAMDVYNRRDVQDFVQPLSLVVHQLLSNITQNRMSIADWSFRRTCFSQVICVQQLIAVS